jgi:hypothetical protein
VYPDYGGTVVTIAAGQDREEITVSAAKPEARDPPGYIKIILPVALRTKLDTAAAESGLSVAEEIRSRVARTLDHDVRDQRTTALAAKIVWLAEQLKREKGFDWFAHPRANEAFAEAVNVAITHHKRAENSVPAASDLMWGDDDPKTLGRSIERQYERWATGAEDEGRKVKNLMKRGKS